MDKKFNSRFKMFGSTDEVLSLYNRDWSGYAPMVTAVEVFRGQFAGIGAAKEKQEKDIKGYAVSKKINRDAMADLAISICGKVKAWAKDQGDMVTYNEMHITRSMILNGRSATAKTLCQSIYNKAVGMPSAAKTTYNILAGHLASLAESISTYSESSFSPRTRIAMRKSETDSFKKMFTYCTLTLKESIDNLMENFAGTQFYNDYFNGRKIPTDATEKASLTVRVVSEYDGSPLAGVTVNGTDGVVEFQEVTDSQGRIKRSDIKPEIWDLTFTYTNYTTVTTQTDIYAGDKDKVLVKMKSIPK